MRFPNYNQTDFKDCGPTCLKIISKYYGKILSAEKLRRLSETTRDGSNLLGLSGAAESIGFRSLCVTLSPKLLKKASLPCVLHWNNDHFVVLYKIKNQKYFLSDPAFGLIEYSEKEFVERWISEGATVDSNDGVALLLEPTPDFYELEDDVNEKSFGFRHFFKYLIKYKKLLTQLFLGLIASSILQVTFPFLTQSIVDIGIKNQDINFIYLILIAQLSLFIGRIIIDTVRSWILLHVSVRLNISLISDFIVKLMKLPIAYFDSKMTGDILQRINDHSRIEKILTTSSLSVLFSSINLVIFSAILLYYNYKIFTIFLVGSLLYFLWITIFLKKREKLDHKKFSQVSQEQSKIIELINGMQEIKLHNAERRKRWGWEFVQAKLFKISIETLALEQYQSVGSSFINELKNILITVISAKLVIEGEITLGMLIAISYIVGQLNSPIAQLIGFIREFQDAKISLKRLEEVHNIENEINDSNRGNSVNSAGDIELIDVSYRYPGAHRLAIQNLSLSIPNKKITAIVGMSGSGKTTLMKLILGFYKTSNGLIKVGNTQLNEIDPGLWREQCGVVMQEGYIFNDTIAHNIAIKDDVFDREKLKKAVKAANIQSFIEDLPSSYNTKIGSEGVGISVGQKQRVLIARALYKEPNYVFLDEATSSLDANNEKIIQQNLNEIFENKTVLIIAHRLSTVKNADNILVMDKGNIVEKGTHNELISSKGQYYNLIKNQLELDNG